jgi:L,D-transpeptidase catalytic domain
MKPNQRIIFVAVAASGIALTGTAMMLASNEKVAERPNLRLSLSPEQRTRAPARSSSGDAPSRFAYVPPTIGSLMLPPEGSLLPQQSRRNEPAVAAADPDTWAVDVDKRFAVNPGNDMPAATQSREPASKGAQSPKIGRSLQQRLKQISPSAMPRLAAKFEAAKASWPPSEIALVAIKDKKVLELYTRSETGSWTFIHRYRVLAASGASGPKLRRGDRQVPEGVYRISYLNPNSHYHVSLRINYPNRFDRKMAAQDGRHDLGGDIMIHGKRSSAGCLAMGDKAAEELFVLAAQVGLPKIRVIIAPTDLRTTQLPPGRNGPSWLPKLYAEVASAMSEFKAPPKPTLWSLLGL